MWIKHPRSKQPDTMLTISVGGFVFVTMFTAAAMVAAWVLGDSDFLKYVATIDAAILTPTVAAYTVRKYTEFKNDEAFKLPRPPKSQE